MTNRNFDEKWCVCCILRFTSVCLFIISLVLLINYTVDNQLQKQQLHDYMVNTMRLK